MTTEPDEDVEMQPTTQTAIGIASENSAGTHEVSAAPAQEPQPESTFVKAGSQPLRWAIFAVSLLAFLATFALSLTRFILQIQRGCLFDVEPKDLDTFRRTEDMCDAGIGIQILLALTLSLHFNCQGAIAAVVIFIGRGKFVAFVMAIVCCVVTGLTAVAAAISLSLRLPFWSYSFAVLCYLAVSAAEAGMYFLRYRSMPKAEGKDTIAQMDQ
jgi:hypothetical protein